MKNIFCSECKNKTPALQRLKNKIFVWFVFFGANWGHCFVLRQKSIKKGAKTVVLTQNFGDPEPKKV